MKKRKLYRFPLIKITDLHIVERGHTDLEEMSLGNSKASHEVSDAFMCEVLMLRH